MKCLQVVALFSLVSCMVPADLVPGGKQAAAWHTWKLIVPDGTHASTAFPVLCTKLADGVWKTLFLTASHVTDSGKESGWGASQDSERLIQGGVFVAKHPKHDAALLLFLTAKPIEVLYLDAREPRFFEQVWLVGYPGGKHRVITQGIMSRRDMASTPAYKGNSGGPVIDSSGAVLGVAEAIMLARHKDRVTVVTHVLRFTLLVDISDWLQTYKIKT